MKKLVVLLTLVAAVSAYSQGTINFATKVSATAPAISVDAVVTYGAGGPATAASKPNSALLGAFQGSTALSALYGGPVGTAEANLVLLTPSVGFRSGAAAGYIAGGNRTIDAVAPGGSAFVQLRAWDTGVAGSTWEGLSAGVQHYAGKSSIITVGPLGGGSPPATPPNLVDIATQTTLGAVTMAFVPEPSIIGLGILGAIGGLMVFRRRN